MPSDHSSRTTTAKPAGAPPPEPEHLPCPRCDSTNTKFCYYNNYNFSQPRHFCKACRRYWTHGGTLRDIPVGGGSRKNAKRSRLMTPSNSINNNNNNNNNNNSSTLEFRHMAPPVATPILYPFAGEHGGGFQLNQFLGDGKQGVSMCESFMSLLNSTQGPVGFGGFEDGGFGFGRGVWPFSGVGDGGGGGNGEGGLSWPDLAI